MRSFNWILDGRLAGSGRPGLLNPLEQDLDWLRAVGIRTIVSLTQRPLLPPTDSTFEWISFPVPDMGIPTPRAALGLCQEISRRMDREQPVLFHCKAGLGRTGTMMACTLVTRGASPEEAIGSVRRVSSYYIQSQIQERFISHYAEFLQSEEAQEPSPESLSSSIGGLVGGAAGEP